MSSYGARRFPKLYGNGEIKVSRYIVLYIAQIAWFALGFYLYWGAFWPSTCTPDNLIEVYGCSIQLPENGGWREATLLTWLWSTPILIALEISRRFGRNRDF